MNTELSASAVCEELVQHFESLHDGDLRAIGLQPKLCPAGYWTIGFGRVVIDPVTKGTVRGEEGRARALQLWPQLSVVDAIRFLREDLAIRANRVRKLAQRKLLQHQFDALVSFEYNTGKLGSASLLRHVNAGKWAEAAAEFLKWDMARVNGKLVELPGLVRRRQAERELFIGGNWKRFLR